MKTLFLMALALVLAGCGQNQEIVLAPEARSADQCLRAELFKTCMASLPAGPQRTQYNDWDEVVDACESAAYYQSIRKQSQIKPECS